MATHKWKEKSRSIYENRDGLYKQVFLQTPSGCFNMPLRRV